MFGNDRLNFTFEIPESKFLLSCKVLIVAYRVASSKSFVPEEFIAAALDTLQKHINLIIMLVCVFKSYSSGYSFFENTRSVLFDILIKIVKIDH